MEIKLTEKLFHLDWYKTGLLALFTLKHISNKKFIVKEFKNIYNK